ncbi:hypothetical protein HDU76_010952 [Blyttiomyces sp. JEL0837]|nr:hypothetical protein HDU76_010952 [Blyttiomyces sp. JEL0837]
MSEQTSTSSSPVTAHDTTAPPPNSNTNPHISANSQSAPPQPMSYPSPSATTPLPTGSNITNPTEVWERFCQKWQLSSDDLYMMEMTQFNDTLQSHQVPMGDAMLLYQYRGERERSERRAEERLRQDETRLRQEETRLRQEAERLAERLLTENRVGTTAFQHIGAFHRVARFREDLTTLSSPSSAPSSSSSSLIDDGRGQISLFWTASISPGHNEADGRAAADSGVSSLQSVHNTTAGRSLPTAAPTPNPSSSTGPTTSSTSSSITSATSEQAASSSEEGVGGGSGGSGET